MKYRYLGNSGLLVSTLSIGSWVTFDTQLDVDKAYEILAHAYKNGINFFDNAEGYAKGVSELIMGKVVQRGIDKGVWTREDLTLLANGLEDRIEKADKLAEIAQEIGATLAHVKQLDENLKALEFIDKITPEIREKVDAIVQFVPMVVARAEPFVYGLREEFL
ncbi:hypothetical protein PybrP1_006974 [[Pythium] brassicae (nom. inval.)]|nr:hypothetical protein PybrP1_006974 [[Pythium] brassicae (nom. inval.)]